VFSSAQVSVVFISEEVQALYSTEPRDTLLWSFRMLSCESHLMRFGIIGNFGGGGGLFSVGGTIIWRQEKMHTFRMA
jgi:hypothetical protein